VALNVLREGAHLVQRATSGLMDEALDAESLAAIDAALASFRQRTIRFDHLASRSAGQRRFIDLHMHMPADWSLGQAAAVRGEVEQALMNAVPGLRATIQLLPLGVETRQEQQP